MYPSKMVNELQTSEGGMLQALLCDPKNACTQTKQHERNLRVFHKLAEK